MVMLICIQQNCLLSPYFSQSRWLSSFVHRFFCFCPCFQHGRKELWLWNNNFIWWHELIVGFVYLDLRDTWNAEVLLLTKKVDVAKLSEENDSTEFYKKCSSWGCFYSGYSLCMMLIFSNCHCWSLLEISHTPLKCPEHSEPRWCNLHTFCVYP